MAARQWMSRALIGLAAFATACTDDGVSLHTICPIVPDITDNACIWDPGSNLCVADGVLNLDAADYYRLNLKVESGLKSRMRDVPPLGETNGLQITKAWVELRIPSGDTINFEWADNTGTHKLDNPFWVSASGYLDPMGSVVVPVTIISKEYVERFQASTALLQIVATVKLHGKTSGQEEVDSDEFSWPIRLIRADPLQVNNECIPGISYCLGSLGQDGFALACKDSASSSN